MAVSWQEGRCLLSQPTSQGRLALSLGRGRREQRRRASQAEAFLITIGVQTVPADMHNERAVGPAADVAADALTIILDLDLSLAG